MRKRHVGGMLFCAVMAAMAMFQAPPARADFDQLEERCRALLEPKADPAVFAGAARFGSPDHILSASIKRRLLYWYEWVAIRPDVEVILERAGSGRRLPDGDPDAVVERRQNPASSSRVASETVIRLVAGTGDGVEPRSLGRRADRLRL